MLFYEAGKRGYFIASTDGKIPPVGFHIPSKMCGLWFPPFRILEQIHVPALKGEGRLKLGPPRSLLFKEGTLSFLMSHCLPRFYITYEGKESPLILSFCEVPVWLSERIGFKERTPALVKTGRGKAALLLKNAGKRFMIEASKDFAVIGTSAVFERVNKLTVAIGEKLDGDLPSLLLSDLEEKRRTLKGLPWPLGMLSEMFLECGRGGGAIAGFPEYPWWFGIDTFFIGLAYLRLGMYGELRRSIENLLLYAEGAIPHEVVTNGVVAHPGRPIETLLMVWLVAEYFKETGDVAFAREAGRELLRLAKGLLEKDPFPSGPGFLELKELESKRLKLLDNATSAFAAAEGGAFLSKALEEEQSFWESLLRFYKGEFIRRWWWGDRFVTAWDGRKPLLELHFTQVFPLFLGLVPRRVAEKLVSTLVSCGLVGPRGVLHSLAKGEGQGGFYGSKEGEVFWIGNAILKGALKGYGLMPEILDTLDALFEEDISRFKFAPEIVGGKGCFAQAWSVLFALL